MNLVFQQKTLPEKGNLVRFHTSNRNEACRFVVRGSHIVGNGLSRTVHNDLTVYGMVLSVIGAHSSADLSDVTYHLLP